MDGTRCGSGIYRFEFEIEYELKRNEDLSDLGLDFAGF
ncbi:hypothetical protein DSBG_2323 [Desulfosporosinus sp. BG]|nr:hypothetical protein DSBG_2323 [Desulfosporosinus sp. BG]